MVAMGLWLLWVYGCYGFMNVADFGNTPGHYASEGGHPSCLNCFLQHDGEVDILNIKGDTPLETARKFGHPLLMEKGGKNWMVFLKDGNITYW